MVTRLPPILCLSTEDWDTPLPTNKKQLMSRFAAGGTPVLWVDTVGTRRPRLSRKDFLRIARRLIAGARPTVPQPGLRRVSPLVIPGGWKRLNRLLFKKSLWGAMQQSRISGYLLWVYNPYAVDYLPALSPPRLIVYHCVDDLSTVPGARGTAIRRAEEALLRRADLVFCTAPILFERCRAFNEHTHYLPNVADFKHFAQAGQQGDVPGRIQTIPPPRVVFAGHLVDYKIDFDLLAATARARPHWQFILIGPEWPGNAPGSLNAVKRMPNVHFTGGVPYELLPDWLRGADVLILPYRLGPRTRTIFPLKLFEFLATGKPVVATALPALLEFAGLIPLTDSPGAFIEAIEGALSGAQNGKQADRLALARANTWETRIDQMTSLIMARLKKKST
ncbi:MAG: glycosyltransferase family 1 protein [Candidatus Sumerlaeia bacterium]